MTGGFSTGENAASDDARVGVQAQVVIGDVTVYQLPPGASPEQTFRVGVRYLDGGMASRARELIGAVVTAPEVETWEVRYYWLLAMLSGRTLSQLSREEREQLTAAENRYLLSSGDEWVRCVQVVFRLLTALRARELFGTEGEPSVDAVVKEFDELGPARCEEILRHLDVLLNGPLADEMWDRELRIATDRQMSADRQDRAWMFFQPKPAKPIQPWVSPPATTVADRLAVGAGMVVFAFAFGEIGLHLLRHGDGWGLIGYLLTAIGCYASAVNGAQWRFTTRWRHAADKNFPPDKPATKFASGVDRAFTRYFARYVPHGTDRGTWLHATGQIRVRLRDEVVATYQGHVKNADQLEWLIRHQVAETRKRWEAGTLSDEYEQLQPSAAGIRCGAGLVAVAVGGIWVLVTAPAEVLIGAVAMAGGWWAARGWLRVAVERRRFAADQAAAQRRKASAEVAYASWREKIASRPSDAEMAAWLEYDRKLLMSHAMRSCGLARSSVIAYAFIERPGDHPRRARVRNGPWRYTSYKILLFLLTSHGVRQVTADLDFMCPAFQIRDEIGYRFDMIVSARVTKMDEQDERPDSEGKQRFVLTLVTGKPLSFVVTDPGTDELQQDEDADKVSAATLDATGFTNALKVLQGIAADGKEWLATRN